MTPIMAAAQSMNTEASALKMRQCYANSPREKPRTACTTCPLSGRDPASLGWREKLDQTKRAGMADQLTS